MAYIIDKCRRY